MNDNVSQLTAPALPQFLERPRAATKTFGSLSKNGDVWELQAEPHVIIMAKRLFPGARGRREGHAKFSASKRIFADLVWFMQRYPLEIKDQAAWDEAYQETCAFTAKRAALQEHPEPGHPGLAFNGTLKHFQEEGLSWMLTNRRTLLGDEMGLGKTPSGLAFLSAAQDWPALIVVQPHLMKQWEGQIQRFLRTIPGGDLPLFAHGEAGEALTLHVIRGTKTKELPKAHIYLTHYLLLRHWRETFEELKPKTLLLDEVQEMRRTGTEKYSAASVIACQAQNCIGLSGTPIYNRGAEIWNVMNIIDYHCLGDSDSFTREWCSGYGNDTVKKPELLHAHLVREGLMLRRRKEDVLSELPDKRRIVENVDSDESMAAELIAEAKRLATGSLAMVDPFERGRAEAEAINYMRRATGVSKAPAVATFIRGLAEAEEPTLIFAHHHAVVDRLLEDLKDLNPVCITGRQNEREKEEAKRLFIKGDTNLCIISLRAAAGIDGLQERARCVVFAELDWSPAVHSQAEDRAHRMGVKDSVLCYYLVTNFGTDPDMQEALGLKVSQFIGIMGDNEETQEDRALAIESAKDHMQRIIQRLRGAA